jgi:hypothetical protein
MEKELMNETIKWIEKAENKRERLVLLEKTKEDLVKNIDAYIDDSRNFLSLEKYVLAFESIIWAWAWLEILEELAVIKT